MINNWVLLIPWNLYKVLLVLTRKKWHYPENHVLDFQIILNIYLILHLL